MAWGIQQVTYTRDTHQNGEISNVSAMGVVHVGWMTSGENTKFPVAHTAANYILLVIFKFIEEHDSDCIWIEMLTSAHMAMHGTQIE